MSNFRRKLSINRGESDDWLKTLKTMDCVFYAPLNKEGDLTEHITGTEGFSYTVSSYPLPNDNLTWSSENKSYLLHAKYGGQSAITFPIPSLIERLKTNDITHVVTVKLGSLNKFCYTFGIGTADPNTQDLRYGYPLDNWYNKTTIPQTDFVTLIVTMNYNDKIAKFYKDGNYITSVNRGATWNGWVSNWKPLWYSNITIEGCYGSDPWNSSYEGQAYFKECTLFNKVLTQEEIEIIVNHNNN